MNEIDLIVSLANSYESSLVFKSQITELDVTVTVKKEFYRDLVNFVLEKAEFNLIPPMDPSGPLEEISIVDSPRQKWELVPRWNGWTYVSIQHKDFQKGWFVTHGLDGKSEYDFIQKVSRISRPWLLRRIELVKSEFEGQNRRMSRFYKEYPHQFFREIYTEEFHKTYNSKGEQIPPFYPTVHVLDVNRKIWYYYDGILFNKVIFNLRDTVHGCTKRGSCYETERNCDDILDASIAFEQEVVMKRLGSVEVLANMSSEFKDKIVNHVCRQKIQFRESDEGITKGI